MKDAFTTCKSCHYEALTWHDDLNCLMDCRKCGGKLEAIAKEEKNET